MNITKPLKHRTIKISEECYQKIKEIKYLYDVSYVRIIQEAVEDINLDKLKQDTV